MTLVKLSDAVEVCRHIDHEPPRTVDLTPGTWLHVCPGCGTTTRLVVARPLDRLITSSARRLPVVDNCDDCHRPIASGQLYCVGPPPRHVSCPRPRRVER